MTDAELIRQYLAQHSVGATPSTFHSGMLETISGEGMSQTVFVWADNCLVKQERHGFNKLKRMRYLPLVIDGQRSHTECLFHTILLSVFADSKDAERQAAALASGVAEIFPNKTAENREWCIGEDHIIVAVTEALARYGQAAAKARGDIQAAILEHQGQRRDTLRNRALRP